MTSQNNTTGYSMFFRNLTLFRFPVALDLSDLDAHLGECALKPVGPLELSSRGFIPPFGHHGEALSHAIEESLWITVGGEDKLLPGAVVNDLLQKKLAAIEEKEGRKPGGRTRKRIKDELVTELLPRAFVRPVRSDALIDTRLGVIAIDTSSRKNAESVVSEVRRALGSFPALPVNAEVAPRAILTGWIAGDPLPDGLSLGDECELRDPADSGAVVKIQRMELVGDEIAKHLEAGKQCTRLALTLDDHLGFVIGEDLVVRKFKLLDGAVDQLESTERDDIAAELDARFALMAGEFKRLFAVLEKAFKLSKAD
jgi:recombination associated protein RdgC